MTQFFSHPLTKMLLFGIMFWCTNNFSLIFFLFKNYVYPSDSHLVMLAVDNFFAFRAASYTFALRGHMDASVFTAFVTVVYTGYVFAAVLSIMPLLVVCSRLIWLVAASCVAGFGG